MEVAEWVTSVLVRPGSLPVWGADGSRCVLTELFSELKIASSVDVEVESVLCVTSKYPKLACSKRL